MPEHPEPESWTKKFNKEKREYRLKTGQILEGTLVLFPETFAVGTDNKPYSTIEGVNRSQYSSHTEPVHLPIDSHTKAKLDGGYSNVEYLMREHNPGKVFFAKRGKQMVFAAGHHCMTVHWGLEAHPMVIPRTDFDLMTSYSVPGPLAKKDASKAKAEKLRQYLIPQALNEPLSRKAEEQHYIRIYAAIVCPTLVFAVVDFSRLVRLFITSRDRPWTADDFEVSSVSWRETIWRPFNGGPDWNTERSLALCNLDLWRTQVLSRRRTNATIYKSMGDNTNESFAGFGCHLINDLLATIPLHPATPAYDVCADTRTFERFKATMCTYMDQWNSPTFLNKICTRSNDSNPFAFAATTDTLYTSMFIFVFRKAVAKVSTTLYNKMTAQGLLDPRHTIGEPYTTPHEHLLRNTESVRVPVYHLKNGSFKVYTLIRAKPPPSAGWIEFDETEPRDLRTKGTKTTIGPDNFLENTCNKPDPKTAAKMVATRGRPPGRSRRVGTSGQGPKSKSRQELEKDARQPETIRAESARLREKFAGFYPLPEVRDAETAVDPEELHVDEGQRRSKRLRLK